MSEPFSVCECGHSTIDHRREKDHDECTIGECECDTIRPIRKPDSDSVGKGWTVRQADGLSLLIDSQGSVVTATLPRELAMHIAIQVNMDIARHTPEYEQEGRELSRVASLVGKVHDFTAITDGVLENVITALGQCQKGTARQFIDNALRAVAATPSGGGEKWTDTDAFCENCREDTKRA